jgi:predicted  nucleic acid-binding Zn-ribbon protein
MPTIFMKKRSVYIFVLILWAMVSCRSEIKEDRVKKEASRSLEIALDYIKTQRELHEFDLNRKIRMANDKIRRINSKVTDADERKQKITVLEVEKADLELKLKVLQANTDASTKRITEKWTKYNQSLDAMLKNMEDYLKGIPIDKDTLSVKDTLK